MAISKIITGSLTDDVVTSAKIGTDQVGADALSSSAISGAVDIPANSVGESELSVDYTAQSVPHIVPDVLYPSYVASGTSNKLLDGTTNHSGAFGTEQSDGRKYYYTNIKGSKPIKDPRIGAHFGSQRHKVKSVQSLEQETATHGKGVYTIDGREWMRYVDQGTLEYGITNGLDGMFLNTSSGTSAVNEFFEIVGYFADANIIASRHNTATVGHFKWSIDGGSETLHTAIRTTAATPLGARYVDEGSVHNIGCGATLGIHTLKIRTTDNGDSTGQIIRVFGFELIAQDTTSTANRSKIQIPSQDVVSFGKKFNVSGTPHYDPFNGFTSGNLASVQALGIDTDTSLGLSKWLPSDAGTTYYRPFNGGRIIKWVDSSGVIKTSVNMMPPNAKSIANSASPTNAFATRTTASHFGTNNAMNSFEAGTDLDSDGLSEIAKSFYIREFGNGSANGNASYADLSTLNTSTNTAYVMDDGLTSVASGANRWSGFAEGLHRNTSSSKFYHTFIGTGIGRHGNQSGGLIETWAQNLPYGTHILSMIMDGADTSDWFLDGVRIYDNSGGVANYHNIGEQLHIYQPKKPPIPEDAVVLADYMLMADFVPQSSAGVGSVSKGSRIVDCSRDLFYDASSGSNALSHGQISSSGFKINSNTTGSAGVYFGKVPAFGTNFLWKGYDVGGRGQLKVNGSNATQTTTTGGAFGHVGYISSGSEPNLGVNTFEATNKASKELMIEHFEIATPIHTSSHYQSFETPFLHELIGGDRSMEQTNLICSSDGKSWDEITRDTNYMGPSTQLVVASDGGHWNDSAGLTDHRGFFSRFGLGNKNTAWGYDRAIILEDGLYDITLICTTTGGQGDIRIQRNSTGPSQQSGGTVYALIANDHSNQVQAVFHCIRGDYIFIDEANASGSIYGGNQETGAKLIITKIS